MHSVFTYFLHSIITLLELELYILHFYVQVGVLSLNLRFVAPYLLSSVQQGQPLE